MSSEWTDADVHAALSRVADPEVPVTLVDLGVIRSVDIAGNDVRVLMRPTRLACPGQWEMARRVEQAVLAVNPAARVTIDWEIAAWSGAGVSAEGRRDLMHSGYADPGDAHVACPYCSSKEVRRAGDFGGATCKAPFTCATCGSTFDALKGAVSSAAPPAVG